MTSDDCQQFESMPPNYNIYRLKPDRGPKYILVKRIFASYKFVEVDKETFLSNYHSQFSTDFEWFGMVDDGKYPFLSIPTPCFQDSAFPAAFVAPKMLT
jgi:hypothetical protein